MPWIDVHRREVPEYAVVRLMFDLYRTRIIGGVGVTSRCAGFTTETQRTQRKSVYDRDDHTQHPRDQQGQWRDTRLIVSTAAARQTSRHAHDERARQYIQHVMAAEMVGNPPHFRTGRLRAGYAGVGDWQAFTRLVDRLGADSTALDEISSSVKPEHSSLYNQISFHNLSVECEGALPWISTCTIFLIPDGEYR